MVRLQEALRSGGLRAIDDAAAPLVARFAAPLVAHCERMIISARRPLGIEALDLAQDAWTRALAQLRDPDAAPIRDDEHFEKLLWTIARTRFLDHLDRCRRHNDAELDAPIYARGGGDSWTVAERLAAPQTAEGDLFFGNDGVLLPLVTAAFIGDDAFRSACVRSPRRKSAHYRALVLFALAECWRDEVGLTDREDAGGASADESADGLRHYIRQLGVPDADWERVASAIGPSGTTSDDALFEAINGCCGTQIRSRATLSVLRYELSRLAGLTVRREGPKKR